MRAPGVLIHVAKNAAALEPLELNPAHARASTLGLFPQEVHNL
jgi:hypothetical protein